MSKEFVRTYWLAQGQTLDAARAHLAKLARVHEAAEDLRKRHAADGYYPGGAFGDAAMSALYFIKLPTVPGLKNLKKDERSRWVPDTKTPEGKQLAADIKALPRRPNWGDFGTAIDVKGNCHMSILWDGRCYTPVIFEQIGDDIVLQVRSIEEAGVVAIDHPLDANVGSTWLPPGCTEVNRLQEWQVVKLRAEWDDKKKAAKLAAQQRKPLSDRLAELASPDTSAKRFA